MLIVCPSCATAFRVTTTALGDAGRQVRCARCRTIWLATPDSAIAEPVVAQAVAETGSAGAVDQAPEDDWGAAFAEEARDKPRAEPA
ncbi:MJ0042-type zinc finger domain-containing protein, partial [Escherichia coli]|uniref:MJ0042-type zinc finger domain-containing protein n=1 Tax=Escherichia coli TaxID=562 RepID=UPI00202E5D53